MRRYEINLDDQPTFLHSLGMERNTKPTTVSLKPEILAKGKERAALFRMKFSHYVGWLIERDYDSGTKTILIRAKPPEGQELRDDQ